MKYWVIVLLSLLLPVAARSQNVTTGALNTTVFCEGANVTVSYTASGVFGAKNVFSVQLSDASGSFSAFQIIGQVKSATSGTITATLPMDTGRHYRLRVMASTPYTVGNDNGSDITIAAPLGWMGFGPSKRAILTGDSVTFTAMGFPAGTTYQWTFGSGAIPSTSTDASPTVTFTTAGARRIHLRGSFQSACTASPYDTSDVFRVFDCNPAIPSTVMIDSVPGMTLSSFGDTSDVWVVPGGSLDLSNGDGKRDRTIYVEPGGIVTNGLGKIIYLRDGALFTQGSWGSNNHVIAGNGAGVSANGNTVLRCSSLSYDYTNAPPYKAMPAAGVSSPEASVSVAVYPNPASGIVTIEAGEIPTAITVRNSLGDEVWSDRGLLEKRIQFDVSRYAEGTYFAQLRFGNARRIVEFAIAKK